MFATLLSSRKLYYLELLLFFSPFLDAGKREALADYALVVAVLVMSCITSYFVRDLQSKYGIDLDKTVLMKLNTTINNDCNLFLFSFIGQYSLKTVPNLITPYIETQDGRSCW